jgi:hypothetical protein
MELRGGAGQKNAGIIKKFGGGQGLEAFVEDRRAAPLPGSYGELEKPPPWAENTL